MKYKLFFVLVLSITSRCVDALEEPIKVARGDENYPPMEYVENGQLTGFHIELVSRVLADLGHRVEFVNLPWKRALRQLEKGNVDAVTFMSKTEARSHYTIFHPQNILSVSHLAFIRNRLADARFPFNGNLDSVKNQRVVVPLGFKFGNHFDTYPFTNRVEISGIDNVLREIANDRNAVAALSINFGQLDYLKLQTPINIDSFEVVKPYIADTDVYIGFSKARHRETLAENFAQSFLNLKQTGFYSKLRHKYHLYESD
ncbi:hypothetical protein BTA51_14695 [Hahella sp. CCB-MM4]|uniref:substrate-binding periplasmic protein n=1 Tax=Hahella sp. (strain CCB-MM4) TaxID=1926491 RepID=UPI000B9B8810|nr:transporter substrate-binding domain-containing protein [Hahella sp. CCB-MM4]OZG72767.1 hypothetical protein BTA51_14695 [Hahella sp. CCB-MM4]